MMVLENGTVVLSRTIPYGIDEEIHTITTSTAWGTIANYTEAIEFCRRKTCILRSISGNENKQEDTEEIETEQTLQDKKEITMSFISLVGGISRVIDYYYSKNQGKTLNRMFLTVIGADFSGFSTFLSNELG